MRGLTEQIGDWTIIDRQTNSRFGPLANAVLRLLFVFPEVPKSSSVTWTLRHVASGETRKITASSESEFRERLASKVFD